MRGRPSQAAWSSLSGLGDQTVDRDHPAGGGRRGRTVLDVQHGKVGEQAGGRAAAALLVALNAEDDRPGRRDAGGQPQEPAPAEAQPGVVPGVRLARRRG